MNRGAISGENLEDPLLYCDRNHSRDALPTYRVEFVNSLPGLLVSIHLFDTERSRALLAERPRWRGLSVMYDRNDVDAAVDWSTLTLHIRRLGFVSGVSILTDDHAPAYPKTWILPGRPEGLARLREEVRRHKDRCAAAAGWPTNWRDIPTYRNSFMLPRQGPRHEAQIAKRDPARGFNLQMGMVPW